MAYKLRKIHPPYGTATAPIMEYAYTEPVKVVEGECTVKNESTRQFLLRIGYKDAEDLVNAGAVSTTMPQEPADTERPSKQNKRKRR